MKWRKFQLQSLPQPYCICAADADAWLCEYEAHFLTRLFITSTW